MNSALLAPGESTFGTYAAFLRRRRVAVAGGVLAGILAALALLAFGPRSYAATTDVLVLGHVTGPAADGQATVNLDDEAQLLTSTDLLRDAARRMGGDTRAGDLAGAVEATVSANTTLLSITFHASDAGTARRGADALAEAYLSQRQAVARARLDAARDWLAREQADVARQLQEVLLRLRTPQEQATDPATRDVLAARLGGLRWRLAETAATVPLGGRVVSAAGLPSAPETPIPGLVLISGTLAGLLAGCALGGAREYLSPRIRTAEEVTRRLGAPVLTVVDPGAARADVRRLATLIADEADRDDRPGGPARSFLLAATTPRVRGLAPALVSALQDAGRPACLVRPGVRTAELVPAGGDRAAAGADGAPGSWDDDVEAARARGEVVVIDAAAAGAGTLPPALADALVVVVDLGRTRPHALDRAVARLSRPEQQLVGIVGVGPWRAGHAPWRGSS